MKIIKWGLLGLCGLFVIALLLAGGGLFWGYSQIREAMVPAEPENDVPSLVSYSKAEQPDSGQVDLNSPATLSSISSLIEGGAARPWTRWWWPGGDVSAERACAQLEQLASMGFGGVEIQSFNAGLMFIEDEATQARINSFGSDEYHQMLGQVMACARSADMQVYLNHLSGWPAGGPEVPVEEGMKEVRFADVRVTGGKSLDLTLPQPEPSYNDYIMALGETMMCFDLTNFVSEHRQLLSVTAGKPLFGKRAANPMDATDTVHLDPNSILVLTDKVKDGKLLWDAPEGDWQIIATYIQPSGEAPTLIASERSGFVIDHLDASIVKGHYAYAFGERTGLPEYYGDPLKGFFNDSLEFKVSRFGSADILEAFRQRRGYDLEPYLPVIFRPARDNFFITETMRHRPADDFFLTEFDDRIRHDYQETVSDLIIERFVETSADWAESRGLVSKGQSYGADFDVIKAMGQNTMPESEQLFAGGGETVLKMASASGDLYDRRVISAESFVWYKLAYGVSPAQLKLAADKLFVSGINQIIYHGIPYRPEGKAYEDYFGELDWYPFAGPQNDSNFAGNYGPTSPIWQVLPALNDYLTAAQSLLQSGRQSSDVFIYYPFLGFPHQIEESTLYEEEFLFMGRMPGEPPRAHEPVMEIPLVKLPEMSAEERKDFRLKWLEEVKPLIDGLNDAGITWTWINDDSLTRIDELAGNHAQVIIAAPPSIKRDSIEALTEWGGAEARLFFWRDLPEQQPGFLNHEQNDRWIAEQTAELAKGRQFDSAEELVSQLWSRLALNGADDVRRYTRLLEKGQEIHFLFNQSAESQSPVLTLSDPAEFIYWFDPAARRLSELQLEAEGALTLSLDGFETGFLINSPVPLEDALSPLMPTTSESIVLKDWEITSAENSMTVSDTLPDLREAEAFGHAHGPITYTAEFPAKACECGYVLNLESVAGVATVQVNGTEVGSASFPPFRLDLTEAIQPGDNTLEITVQPPLRNAMVGDYLAGDERLDYMAQHENELSAVGIMGEVVIEILR
tara:strand:- start:14458 stop:17526 length:3069 start_codon:yes stop_codon:yes gene_type:complete